MPHRAWNRNTPENFWANVEINGSTQCWPWKLSCNPGGYGNVGWHGKVYRAHRIAYQLHHNVILPRARPSKTCAVVMHTCDNRICCNPAHLRLGTHLDNRRDCVAKGRDNSPRGDRNGSRTHPERLKRGDENVSRAHPELFQGSKHHNAFLNEEQVLAIRKQLADGARGSQLAKAYGVTMAVIWKIRVRRTWRHV